MPFYPESALHNPVLSLDDESKRPVVIALTQSLLLTPGQALEIKEIFMREMELGLSADEDERKQTSLLMENTFMTRLPSGQEAGDFLSLDLGSTNFRVILSRLKGSGRPEDNEFRVKYYEVPSSLRVGDSARPLFNFLAQCISDFVSSDPDLVGRKLPLGFSFSYPMLHQSVDSGFLVTWTKSYDLTDAVGADAVSFLRDAIASQKDLDVDVVAILNDTTGTLLKGAYLDPDCVIGMGFGSGFNAAYMESVERVLKLTDQNRETLEGCSQVALDTECGGFGDNGCIDRFKNDVDRQVDQESMFPGSYSFEKMLAGNFLGDIARRILLLLAQEGVLFAGILSDGLMTKDSIVAADLVDMEREGALKVQEVGRRIGYETLSEDDIRIIHYVGKVVAVRAAVLTSTLLSALIDRIDRPRTVIAIDGSLYSHHPSMHKLMIDVISELSPGKIFDIVNAKDGSGMGAGLAAAVLTLPHIK